MFLIWWWMLGFVRTGRNHCKYQCNIWSCDACLAIFFLKVAEILVKPTRSYACAVYLWMFEFIWTRRNHCKHNGYEWFHDRRSALFHMGAFSQKSFGLPVSHRHKVRHKVTRAILANLGPETVFSVLGVGHGRAGRSGDHVSIFAGIPRPRPKTCVDSL